VKKAILCIALLWISTAYAQKKYTADWTSIDSRPVPQWYTSAKFGIFIHWGVYSVPSWAPVGKQYDVYSKYAEWYWKRLTDDTTNVGRAFRQHHLDVYGPNVKYPEFAQQFKAELFNPNDWADLFAASGAKYVVLTSKHHDGFALWPTAQSWQWNSGDIGPHRDLAGDLMKAIKSHGLKMGYYYSLYEWYNPLYKADVNRYVDEHMMPQMKDLVTRYKPDIFWTDGEWEQPSSVWKSTQFLSWLYNDSPVKDVVAVNDRWGKETRGHHGGYYTTEYDRVDNDNVKDKKIFHPWEECRAIGGSFGLNRAENLADYNTPDNLIKLLIEKVAKGGNLLLDIGPAADGTIPVIMQQRLTEMGKWLKINGEAIFDTQQWEQAPNKSAAGVYFTRKGNDIYILCSDYNGGKISINNIRQPASVSLLGSNNSINSTYKNDVLTILPALVGQPVGANTFVYKLKNVL
jgi:alpha-L-fucosidase